MSNACLVYLTVALATADQPTPDIAALRTAGETLVDRLSAGDYAAALAAYAPAAGATADTLRDQWQQAVREAGPFRKRAAGTAVVRGTGVMVPVRCTFANKDLDAVLFCTPAGAVSRMVVIPPPLSGPGLVRAEAAEVFRPAEPGAAGTVTFPVPGVDRDQVPLALRLEVQPAEALTASRWVRRADGRNWLLEVDVAPPGDRVLVRWEALVFVGGRPPAALPPAAAPAAPEEAAAWLRSTGCVQSDDPGVRAKAEELARGTTDVGEYARRVARFTTLNPYRGELLRALDARDALRSGSSCTGRAQLAAALLRARGIPARTVAHLPTWCGPLFCHWLVEYWHPGAGWVRMEPTLDQPQPPAWTTVVVNVAGPADEDDAFAWTRASGVMAGVPRRAARELTGGLRPLADPAEQTRRGAVNRATPEITLRGTEAELDGLRAAARRAFDGWAVPGRPADTDRGRTDRLLAAARTGRAEPLTDALRRP